MERNTGSIRPSNELAAAVKAAIVRDGEAATVERLKLSRIALSKLAAGLPTRRGTQAQAALGLGLLDSVAGDGVTAVSGGRRG